ncbi:MAG: bifunctional phosphopantothenoylcysteine decarboxylase/phosphopantothenate--cysteine ligase CoaBC [Chloroflexota bacterium]
MPNILHGKRILLGVTGSIACYKAADLASRLTKEEAVVTAVLTQSACQFISPLTFQSVTAQRAYTDQDLWGSEGHVQHIGLGLGADLICIAPATANTIAKLAHGIADNLLTLASLAARCPVLVAPAMDGGMFGHPATQANIEMLQNRAVYLAGPAEGRMASGLVGRGRMLEPLELLGHIRYLLSREGKLRGTHIVVTAGGTAEPIDAVRAITNRSSGKQGFALAQSALDYGADVTLISANSPLPTPIGAQRVDVSSAQEMLTAVLQAIESADALIMAAAVADFQPIASSSQKIKKEDGIPEIKLTLTPDILAAVAQMRSHSTSPRVVIGFAAESTDLIENARRKLTNKKLDLIVANDITAPDSGFTVDTNRVVLLDASGNVDKYPLMSKAEVAELVIQRLIKLLE